MNSAGSFSNSTANRSTDFLQEKQVASLVQMERVGDRVSVCFLLLCTLSRVLCQQCGGPCSCPLPAPRCPVGVPLVLDGCRCCRVCAGQLGEACSERLVCDGWRGLRCDHSASYPGEPGECVGQSGLGCELNGVTYQEGQVFQPSCALRCQCEGGGVTCTRLCADDLKLPTPDCPNPRHVQLPGKCCREWVCKDAENPVLHDAMAAYSLEMMDQNQNCIEHSTEWGACSQSCGPGVSVRVSNRNRACRLETQTRLCQVRPCHALFRRTPTTPGRCEPSYRAGVPVRLELWDCVSVWAYRPRYCGHCSDGRCCSPGRSHTVPVAFRCPRGHLLYYPVMAMESCTCHYNCPHVVTRGPMRPLFLNKGVLSRQG